VTRGPLNLLGGATRGPLEQYQQLAGRSPGDDFKEPAYPRRRDKFPAMDQGDKRGPVAMSPFFVHGYKQRLEGRRRGRYETTFARTSTAAADSLGLWHQL